MKQKILIAFLFIGMITLNALANILPINNISTGEISDMYANLFAPIGFTFSIWGLIYLLLFLYLLYYLSSPKREIFSKINKYFAFNMLANSLWILAWHYDYIFISLLLMIVILISLIKISDILRRERLNLKDKLLIKLGFSIYFGWITVATVANVTVLLVANNFSGLGLAESWWTVLILIVALAIGLIRAFYDKNVAYLLVFLWAYYGIYAKHQVNNFGFSEINITLIASLIIIFISSLYLLIKYKRIV
jgi:hypothetical protein